MKAYITIYALGISGPFAFECEEYRFASIDAVAGYRPNAPNHKRYFWGKDVHRTKESALARCEEMREEKLKELEEKRVKISGKIFEIIDEL